MVMAGNAVRRMRRDLHRGTWLVPTALTMANICLGYFGIVKSIGGEFLDASLLIACAGVLDKFDGVVARAMDAASDLGRELDSLADVISFGVAPSLLVFEWGLKPLGRIGWAGAFLFLACGALRLARFNVASGRSDSRFFVGLPIPMAASLPVTAILAFTLLGRDAAHPDGVAVTDRGLALIVLAVLVGVALLMVSGVRYLSFKKLPLGPEKRMPVTLGLVLVGVGVLGAPEIVLPALSISYVLHGPFMKLTGWQPSWTRLPEPAREDEDETAAGLGGDAP